MGLKTMDANGRSPDKMRLCPSCRMEISVLATVCRFCGLEVGRPKEEQRQFSIDDLGGEHVEHHSPSNSIMEALEEFRSEMTNQKETKAKKTSIFSRKSVPPPAVPPKDPGLPELDARSQELASLTGGGRSFIHGKHRARKKKSSSSVDWLRHALVFAAVVVAILILYFGGIQVMAVIRNMQTDEPVNVFEPANPAIQLLERNGPPIDTLQEAVRHYREYPTETNAAILDRARNRIEQDIHALVNSVPFTNRAHRDANSLVNAAHSVDPNHFGSIKDEVAREIRIYNSRLVQTSHESSPRTATIQLTNPNQTTSEITISEGNTFHEGRFRLELVRRDEVILIDTVRGNRRLRLSPVQGITPA